MHVQNERNINDLLFPKWKMNQYPTIDEMLPDSMPASRSKTEAYEHERRENGAKDKERKYLRHVIADINQGNWNKAYADLGHYREHYKVTSNLWTAAQLAQVLSGLEKAVEEKQPVTVEITKTGIQVKPKQ